MTLALLAYDLVTLLLGILFYGGALYASVRAYEVLVRLLPWSLAVPPSAFVFLLTLIVEVSLACRLCPKPRPGRYRLMKGPVFWGWLLRMTFTRLLFLPFLQSLIFYSYVLRFLTLRALGARVAFTANMSSDVSLLDPALLTVGPGATIGARTIISGHFLEAGELRLDEVHIGEGALLGLDVACAPGVVVGKRVIVQPRTSLSVRVTIGDDAVIGGHCVLDSDVVVSAGARVPTRTYLPPKSRFPSP